MQIPKTKAAWKRLQPTSMRQALRYTKEYARAVKRLTVPAIAELMGESEDTLYKWISSGRMPATMIRVYEHICGIDYVTQYLAYSSHKLVIDIPTGALATETEISELQRIAADSIALLLRHYSTGENLDETVAYLTKLMGSAAWHRQNIQTQPELDFEGGNG